MLKVIRLKTVREQEKQKNLILAQVDLNDIVKTIEVHLKIYDDEQQNTDCRR